MDEVKIMATEDGPYLVQGPAQIIDADGRPFTTTTKNVALCRCGGSQTKPFCDGTHSKIGFEAAERAVAEEERRRVSLEQDPARPTGQAG